MGTEVTHDVNLVPGFVYILRSPLHTDALVKVGLTRSSSEEGAKQLSSATGVPYPFEVFYEESVVDCVLAEKLVHERLAEYRQNPRREFFKVPLKIAIKAVFEVCMHVNRALITEDSRLVAAVRSDSETVGDLRDLLTRYSGGPTRFSLLYTSEQRRALLVLGEQWMIRCTPELIDELQKESWVDSLTFIQRDHPKFDPPTFD
jgi:hypothetical protein